VTATVEDRIASRAKQAPPRVKNIETYWSKPPPEPSPRLLYWRRRFDAGWRPGRRIDGLSYYSKARYYGVYLWEYLNVIYWLPDEPPPGQEPR
jgi:hypothetical protein